jgi:transcription elongation factor Elf1
MGWLDSIEIGHDLQICPDCDQEYEVLEQFLGESQNRLSDWIDAVFKPTQFHTEKEKENKI